MLEGLLKRSTSQKKNFPEEYAKARIKGKWRIQAMDNLRGGIKFIDNSKDYKVKEFWNGIC